MQSWKKGFRQIHEIKQNTVGFSTECFKADFLQILTKKRQSLAFALMAGYSPSNLSSSEIF